MSFAVIGAGLGNAGPPSGILTCGSTIGDGIAPIGYFNGVGSGTIRVGHSLVLGATGIGPT